MIFLVVMAWMVWVKVLSTGTQTTSDLQLPIRYFYAIAAFGVCASVLLALMRLVRLINRTPIEEPDGEIQHGS